MFARIHQAWKAHRSALPRLLLKKAVAKLIRTETLVVYQQRLCSGVRVALAHDARIHVVPIDEPNAELFHALCAKYPEKDFGSRVRNGNQRCYVALRDNRIAGYAWTTADSLYVDEIAREYHVTEGAIFIYDCFVDSDCRGFGIYPAMLRTVLEDASNNKGLEMAQIAASSLNHASLRGIRKAGFVEWKRIHYVAWAQKQKWWESTPAPSIGSTTAL